MRNETKYTLHSASVANRQQLQVSDKKRTKLVVPKVGHAEVDERLTFIYLSHEMNLPATYASVALNSTCYACICNI